jgi:hypothetical protein
MSECPKGGSHNWRNTHETATEVTHTCTKCGATNTRPKGRMSRGDVACLLLAVLILAAGLTPIWLAARVTP